MLGAMTKRKKVLGLVAVVALAELAGAIAGRASRPPHRINLDGYERIQVDTTLAEVEAVVGVPPGDYAEKPGHEYEDWLLHRSGYPVDQESLRPGYVKYWKSDAGIMRVHFDEEDGLVVEKQFEEYSPSLSWWERLRQRFGW
jgi:hypothetical protein